ncbi:acyl-coenzyme A thioesterase 9, mitochondrial isoform X1 [Anabrus simplex]|uniref:acyl-coenzyme A thioesterase 9, mitochondrial isoform X1 n=1 Tax=Anabrus simplex TaxID=316456 RepID=UPI0035A2E3C3
MSSVLVRSLLRSNSIKNEFKLQLGGVLSICSNNTDPTTTMQDVKAALLKHMGLERGYRPLQPNRSHLLDMLPKNQDELPPRTMQDSFLSAVIPLSSDIVLQEKYVTFLGHVRLGRLMEDMDMFAVWVAHQHIVNPNQVPGEPTPYVLVTVLVDQIDFTDLVPKHDADIRLSGHVSWVGRSSIEVTVWLEQKVFGKWQKLTRAVFLMAARNSTNTAAAVVNRLEPGSEREKEIFLGGEGRKKRRIQSQSTSLLKQVPDDAEQQVIHDIFVSTVDSNDPNFHKRILPSHSVWMDDCTLSNIIFSHPENRNLHNKVFGGFLMRQALELSWTAGYMYSKFRPKLCHISDIGFHKPVDVGSLLRMHAYVTYSEFNYAQILVHAEVIDHRGMHSTTNNFHYTYQMPEEVPKVIPQSYHEAMMYLDGRRHFQRVMGLVK